MPSLMDPEPGRDQRRRGDWGAGRARRAVAATSRSRGRRLFILAYQGLVAGFALY